MSDLNVQVAGGTSVRLLTEGRYCDKNIVVTATGGKNREAEVVAKTISGDYVSEDITSVGTYVFHGCTALTGIDFPNCTYVGNYSFQSTGLQRVNLPSCTKIGPYAFYMASGITELNLPVCTDIETYAFYWGHGFREINLPSCERIGFAAFQNCFYLERVNLPKCTNIGEYAFQQNYQLGTLILGADTVCTLGNPEALASTLIASGTGFVYVKDFLVDSYKADPTWPAYASQIKPMSELGNR